MNRLLALLALIFAAAPAMAQPWPTREGDFVHRNFKFANGDTLPELRIHYTTLGTPHRGKDGRIDNAVMILHGTGGTGKQFLVPQFADELYGPGQPLDIAKYYIILPDNIGHGGSSKPSDGMRMAFPEYDYRDMIEAQLLLLNDGLGIDRLELILGTSMGCMHGFMWGTELPRLVKRLALFACQPVEIAGRNRMWRKMIIDAIQADPAWNNGNYTSQPLNGLRTATYLSVIAGGNPVALQANFPTREKAEEGLAAAFASRGAGVDANNAIYYYNASRNYDPSEWLERMTMPVLWINSADDFINPPELGIAEREVKRMPRARYILIPASAETRGHGTHTWAKFWKAELAQLLATP